jgi:hypothetical protein
MGVEATLVSLPRVHACCRDPWSWDCWQASNVRPSAPCYEILVSCPTGCLTTYGVYQTSQSRLLCLTRPRTNTARRHLSLVIGAQSLVWKPHEMFFGYSITFPMSKIPLLCQLDSAALQLSLTILRLWLGCIGLDASVRS